MEKRTDVLKIAWTSNAPWAGTGYGSQTAEVAPLLKEAGHEVAILANYGLAGSTLGWNDIPVLPQGIDGYSNDLTPSQIRSFIGTEGNGLGVTLFDVWVYQSPEWDELPLLSWTPVDHGPLPPDKVIEFFNRPGRKWSVAMSKSGEKSLLDAGLSRDRVFYAPHSFNPETFHPGPSSMRAKMSIPEDAFLVITNAANKGNTPIRKCFPEMAAAMSVFMSRHPDVFWYLHTEGSGIANGVRIDRLLSAMRVPIDRVRLVPQYEYRMGIDHKVVADLTRAADVSLLTSRGEGFGLPLLESAAVGVPGIGTKWTAQEELIGPGWAIDGQLEWDEFQGSFWKVPNIEAIVAALEESYAEKGTEKAKERSAAAVAHASPYETRKVFANHWVPILDRMRGELRKTPVSQGPNRAARRAAR